MSSLNLAFCLILNCLFHNTASAKSSLPWGLARAICTQNAAFGLRGQIQSGLKDASKYFKLSLGNKQCKAITWSQCVPSSNKCQKFACPNDVLINDKKMAALGRSLGGGDSAVKSKKTRMTKVVNGHDAVPGEFPWMISFSITTPKVPPYSSIQHFCGGTLLNATHVLSAAHCMGSSPKVLVAGAFNLPDYNESTRQIANVKSYVEHPLWNFHTSYGDIAIVEAETPFTLNERVQPLRLPCPNSNPLQDKCLIMGWGILGSDKLKNESHPILQKAKLKVLTTEDCVERFKAYNETKTVTKDHICAGSPCSKFQGECLGDSGGPLVCWDASGPYLAGIVSWGPPDACGDPKLASVFTRASSFVNFIRYNAST